MFESKLKERGCLNDQKQFRQFLCTTSIFRKLFYFFKNCSKTVIFETATYLLIFFCVIPGRSPRTVHYIEKIHCLTRELRVKFHAKNRDITCPRVDMNFIFEWSTRYLTRSLRSLMRYRVEHKSIKLISISEYVISSIYYIKECYMQCGV